MNAFETYQEYVAIKSHFTVENYDYFKYNGQTNLSLESFECRNDKYQFQKLSKLRNPKDYLIANAAAGNIQWPGEIVSEKGYDNYIDWKRRRGSQTYLFKQNLGELDTNFSENFACKNGQYPHLLMLYKRGKITLETLTIMDEILNFIPFWNKKIKDTIIWPDLYLLIRKYKPFVSFDKEIYKKMLKDEFL